jgi:hypothetical protein
MTLSSVAQRKFLTLDIVCAVINLLKAANDL